MPDVRPLRPGDPVAVGEYRLTGRLGEGGQGIVYLGESGPAQVAIKILHDRHAADEKARERLLREVEATRQVPPFCTAKVLDVGLAGERPYVVSEFIDGESLEQRVKSRGPLGARALERLAIGTASALVAIHNAGIVHRDFKPANVLLASDGPRVVDFGIARALDLITSSISVMGTPPYMSPEQFSGAGVGTASDMFSWAGTMIFAATGETPFGQDAIAVVVNRVLHQECDLSGLPESLRPIVGACMAKAPEQRPSARDVLLHLVTGQAPEGHVPVSEGELLQTATARVREVAPQPSGGAAEWGPHGPAGGRPASGASDSGSFQAAAGTPGDGGRAASGALGFAPSDAPAGRPGDGGSAGSFPGAQPGSSPEDRAFPAGSFPDQVRHPDGAPPYGAGAPPYGGEVAPQAGPPGNSPGTIPPNGMPPNTVPPGYGGPATAPSDPSAPRSAASRRRFLIAAGLVLIPAAGAGATALGYRLLDSGGTTTPTSSPPPGGPASSGALSGSPSPSSRPGVSAGATPGPLGTTGVSGAGDPFATGAPTAGPTIVSSAGPTGGPTIVSSAGPTGSAGPSSSGGPTGALVLNGPTVLRHTSSVMSVAVSPDGRQVVSGAWDGRIRVWDIATGKMTAQYNDRKGYIEGLTISPDGRLLISVGGVQDTKGKVWDLTKGRTTGKTVIGSVFAEFSPDGGKFVTGSGFEWARLWRTSNRGQIGAAMRHGVLAKGAAFSPDGRVLAIASWDNSVRLWNASNASSLGSLTGHKEEVNAVTFLGPRLLASVGYDKVVRIWDVRSRKAIVSPLRGPKSLINSVAYTAQGGILACGEDNGRVWLWNASTRRRLGEPLNTSDQVKQVLFTPDGRTLVIASGNEVQLWTISAS